jgi:hypothetical protein
VEGTPYIRKMRVILYPQAPPLLMEDHLLLTDNPPILKVQHTSFYLIRDPLSLITLHPRLTSILVNLLGLYIAQGYPNKAKFLYNRTSPTNPLNNKGKKEEKVKNENNPNN